MSLHYVARSRDKDLDGTLDGKNKSYCTPDAYKGESATLFHNKGNGVFEDVTKSAGLYDPTLNRWESRCWTMTTMGGWTFSSSNDTQRNKLYHNNHDGTFTDTGETRWCRVWRIWRHASRDGR